ncbi:MAG: hypothetical protein J6K65_09395 [Alphaproteobacteria bacterium]|nr:hypothetical protein [Alphaproteobacteria bacterium]
MMDTRKTIVLGNDIYIKLFKYIFALYVGGVTLLASALYVFSTITNWFSLKGEISDIIMYYWIYPICILFGVFVKIYTKRDNNEINKIISYKILFSTVIAIILSILIYIAGCWVFIFFFEHGYKNSFIYSFLLGICFIVLISYFIKFYKKYGKTNLAYVLYSHIFYSILLFIPNAYTTLTFSEVKDKTFVILFMNLAISASILLLFSAVLGVIILFVPTPMKTTNAPDVTQKSNSFFMQLIVYMAIAFTLILSLKII